MCMGIYIYIDRLVVHVPGGENHHGVDDIYIAPGGPGATRHQLASMPARAHRRAPDPLAGAVNPLPPCRGLSPMAPLPKPPGRRPPSTPDPPAVRRTGESVKSPYLPPRRGSSPTPPFQSPGKVPPPRACTPRLALGRPLRAPASPPPHPPVRPTPPPRQLAPHAPLPRAAKPRRPPLAPGLGEGGPPVAHGYVGTGVPGGRTARVALPGPPP